MNIHRRIFLNSFPGIKKNNSGTNSQNDHVLLIFEMRIVPMRHCFGVLGLDGRRYELKTDKRMDFSQHES
jgi:hypothetical protein